MKYAFYPGCVAKGGAPELYDSMVRVAARLDIELIELEEAACTGAGVLHERNPLLADTLNARTFAMAERLGLPLMNICSTCAGSMARAQNNLKNEEYRGKVNRVLADEGLEYKGSSDVKHFMWILVEDVGLDRLKSLVTRPLAGLRVAPFYGCYVVRPKSILGFEEHSERDHYLEMIIDAIGADPVDYFGRDRCCGFPILTMNRTNALAMTAKHVAEAQTEGADFMVTSCPLCHLNLDGQQPDAAAVKGTPLSLPVIHLPQLLGLAMGFNAKDLGLQKHVVSTKGLISRVGA